MTAALAAVVTVALLVVVAATLAALLHRALRPTEMTARSATALRALEPGGGRQRFPVRTFEVVALAATTSAALAVLFCVVAVPRGGQALGWAAGGAIVVAIWWAWRRGTLRTVEAEARPAPAGSEHASGAPDG
ncbi:MAG: hypothetical protein HYS27_02185 [Deltaproteobacteria bacterium]|nr:hypothetical protein [Deltaproteobacteria bacterium]